MSDNETQMTPDAPQTKWGPIIKDMFILVCIMATIGYLCKLAMLPFEHSSPTDSLVSIIRKGDITHGKDVTFLKEMAEGTKQMKDFVNLSDNTGRTPLMWAAYCNFNDPKAASAKDIERLYYVKQLLGTPGIDVHKKDNDGFTALHWAAWSGMTYTSVLLTEAGLDINAPDNNGYTPLMLAALRGNAEVVHVLLLMGADTTLVNHEGKNAEQLAKENERAYNKRVARIFAWTHIPTLEDFNLFELIFSSSREESYLKSIESLKTLPAQVSLETLKKAMDEAVAMAAAKKAKAEAEKSEVQAQENIEEKAAEAPAQSSPAQAPSEQLP